MLSLIFLIITSSQLNIHKFKFVARFGLMHIVATNLCVWVRTLVRENLKEINEFRVTHGRKGEDYMIIGECFGGGCVLGVGLVFYGVWVRGGCWVSVGNVGRGLG